ncbi:MAG: hypothetical protein HUU35_01335, partial [Armatimonadetes bacterium]|nr:hypothetical protein [Armatimonadota bacterium]
GTASYTCQVPAGSPPGLLGLNLLHPELGFAGTAYIDLVTPETKAAFAAAAAKVAAAGEHWLFLGDSLTDFLRGYNYVDQVNYWLQRTHGPGFTVRNAGVGGDYITRVWQRLNGEKTVHRLSMYEALYEPKPARVFIFLGHNDSKQSSASNFVQPLVAPADFELQYRQSIAKLKADTGASITLLSSTSSVFEICQANAERTRAAGRPASLFGRPEMLEQFNAIAQRVAQETGAGYIDVYEPTRTHPDKPTLFTADGVHLTLLGNHLVALRILESLAR